MTTQTPSVMGFFRWRSLIETGASRYKIIAVSTKWICLLRLRWGKTPTNVAITYRRPVLSRATSVVGEQIVGRSRSKNDDYKQATVNVTQYRLINYLSRHVRADRRCQAHTSRRRSSAGGSARRNLAQSERVASSEADRIAADALQRSDRRRRWPPLRPTSLTVAPAARRQSWKPWRRNGNGRIGDLNAAAAECVFLCTCCRSLFCTAESVTVTVRRLRVSSVASRVTPVGLAVPGYSPGTYKFVTVSSRYQPSLSPCPSQGLPG